MSQIQGSHGNKMLETTGYIDLHSGSREREMNVSVEHHLVSLLNQGSQLMKWDLI